MSMYDNLLIQPTILMPPNFYETPDSYIRMIITIEITGKFRIHQFPILTPYNNRDGVNIPG
jgi:hypothetical protein